MSIYFDENGATKDETITADELYLTIKALKLKKFADSQNNEDVNRLDRRSGQKLIKLFEEIYEHTVAQSDRRIHIVVAEPVEYEYPD